jgi:hypothetical protein
MPPDLSTLYTLIPLLYLMTDLPSSYVDYLQGLT